MNSLILTQPRLHIILVLAEGEKHVGGICKTLNQSQPATSHHLALLRHGGIIAPRRQGKNNFSALTEAGEQLASIVSDRKRDIWYELIPSDPPTRITRASRAQRSPRRMGP
jgi:DNA-binding transcriptional ArsR family regulator